MEIDIIEALTDVGYKGPLLNKENLMYAVKGGSKNVEFTKLVSYLTQELQQLCDIDDHVNETKAPEDSISFLLELSSVLKELNCPYQNLTQGHVSDRLATEYDKLLLLDYLSSELMAAQMVRVNKPDKSLEIKLQESPVALDLKLLLLALKFNKPPPNISATVLFQKVAAKLQDVIKQAAPDLVGRPLFGGVLTEKQWHALDKVQKELDTDYTIRREMILKRLDCTIQSFQWSDTLKGKEDQVVQTYYNKRKLLKVDPGIGISDLLAARDDLAIIEKIDNASVRKNTQSSLNKLIIGEVPDRGGRPSEQAAPPPEMPSWQQRSNSSFSGGRGGPSRGGYTRGRGSFNDSNRDKYSDGNYNSQSSYGGGNRGSNSGSRSYDSFQHNKSNYADQYVQDNQYNQQQYGGKRDYNEPRGQRRGRSNYNRGNYR